MGEESLIRTRKVIVSIDRIIDKALTILFLIVLLIGVYFAYDSMYVFNNASLSPLVGYKPTKDNVEMMKTLSPDVVAWITIDNTSIDYPVVQGRTNSEYLNRNVYGDYSLSGSIFLDAGNSSDFSDEYSILYGHHMAHGYMFGALDAFNDLDYFDSHRTGMLTTIEGVRYKLNIFAYMETDASVGVIFDVTNGGDIRGYIFDNAKFYRVNEGRILALSTCKSPLTTDRTVIFATMSEYVD